MKLTTKVVKGRRPRVSGPRGCSPRRGWRGSGCTGLRRFSERESANQIMLQTLTNVVIA